MWACVFSTAYFSRSGAGFEAQWRLVEIVPGRGGAYRLDRGGSLAGGASAPQGTRVSEALTFAEDEYQVQNVFRSGSGLTDRNGIFADVYTFDYATYFRATSAWSSSRPMRCGMNRSAMRFVWQRDPCPLRLRRRCTCAIG